LATWEEDVVVGVALRNRAYGLVDTALGLDKFSEASRARIKERLLSGAIPTEVGVELAWKFPVKERAVFRSVVEPVVVGGFAAQPTMGRLHLKYTFLRGKPVISADTSEDDLVSLLVAPEPLSLKEVDAIKRVLNERAIRLVRLGLRAEGKSFVMKDGVNPLTARVGPGVEALNAPGCEGIEAALRGLGVADMQEHGRERAMRHPGPREGS